MARLSADLTSLDQATYLGGGCPAGLPIGQRCGDFPVATRFTTSDVYVAGLTDSTNFPGTVGGAQSAPGGRSDAFVARLSTDLTALHQATYLGGANDDGAFDLVIAPTTGDVYIAGFTASTVFPGTAGGAQGAPGGGLDAFVARLSADLSSRPTTTTTSTSSSTTTTRPTTTTTSTTQTTSTSTSSSTTTIRATTTTTTIPPTRCGDVNGDGRVDIGDAVLVAQFDVGLRQCGVAPFAHPEVCDVNSDGACNIGDALRLAQCSAGLVGCGTCRPFTCQ